MIYSIGKNNKIELFIIFTMFLRIIIASFISEMKEDLHTWIVKSILDGWSEESQEKANLIIGKFICEIKVYKDEFFVMGCQANVLKGFIDCKDPIVVSVEKSDFRLHKRWYYYRIRNKRC